MPDEEFDVDIAATIALTMGVAWASGINLYAAVLMLGLLGAMGHMELPPDLQVLSDPLVLAAAAFMYLVEFFADKTPGVDTGWDAIHTFIRIPAGAALAAGAVGDVAPAVSIAAGLIGGTIAAGAHATKASTRVVINTSPEPFSNWGASLAEDVGVILGLWMALNYPWLFLALLALFILLMIWLLPKLFAAMKRLWAFLAGLLGNREQARQREPMAATSAGQPPRLKRPQDADPNGKSDA